MALYFVPKIVIVNSNDITAVRIIVVPCYDHDVIIVTISILQIFVETCDDRSAGVDVWLDEGIYEVLTAFFPTAPLCVLQLKFFG